MTTQGNDTLYAGRNNSENQNVNNPQDGKKSFFKDETVAKMMGSAAAGMVLGAGVAYATGHSSNTDEQQKEQETAAAEAPNQAAEQPEGPTVEERLAELEEKERIREAQEQERQRQEQERQQRELQRQRQEQERQRQEEERAHEREEKQTEEKEENFLQAHDVKIEGSFQQTLDNGSTVQMYTGTVDGHAAQFLTDGNGHVLAAAVDANDNGEVDNNEVIDLRQQNITTQQLIQCHVEEEPEVKVVNVQHDVEIEGLGTVDVAVVDVDKERALLIDTNQNGQADLLIADSNHNDNIEENEVQDISANHMPMPSQDDVTDNLMAQTGDGMPDYSNNEDITLYEA